MVEKKALGDFPGIKIIGGQIISRIEAKREEEIAEKVFVLVPKAISNGRIDMKSISKVDIKTEGDHSKRTIEGDIVMKLSSPYSACMITENEKGLLVPSFCAIISNVPTELRKEYLLAYLNSKHCSVQLEKQLSGSTIPIASVGHIKKLIIPVPLKEEQAEIASRYLFGIENSKIFDKIINLEKQLIDQKISELDGLIW